MTLLSPEWMLAEVRAHASDVARRAALAVHDVELLLALLCESIEVVPMATYRPWLETALRLTPADPGDAPFVALALSRPRSAIWTQNVRHFEGTGIEIWTTARLVELVRRQEIMRG